MEQNLVSYSALAPWYDQLMNRVPYHRWAKFIDFSIARAGLTNPVIGDLGCGTGRLTAILNQMGYRIWGMDSCPEMLAQALARSPELRFYQRPLVDLDKEADVFCCTCDGVNHLLTIRDLTSLFVRAYRLLPRGGLLIFDVNSPWKYRHKLAQNCFSYELEQGGVVVWQNYYQRPLNDARLTFMLPAEGGLFKREDTLIRERCYSVKTLIYWLRASGFAITGLWDNYRLHTIRPRTRRIVFVAEKPSM